MIVIKEQPADSSPSKAATEPRRGPKEQTDNTADGEVWVLGKGHTHVEENLLEARYRQLGLDLGWLSCNLVDGLQY